MSFERRDQMAGLDNYLTGGNPHTFPDTHTCTVCGKVNDVIIYSEYGGNYLDNEDQQCEVCGAYLGDQDG